jgi:hypothetical protein
MRWRMRVGVSGGLPCVAAENMCVRCAPKIPGNGDGVSNGRQRSVNVQCLLVPVQVVR